MKLSYVFTLLHILQVPAKKGKGELLFLLLPEVYIFCKNELHSSITVSYSKSDNTVVYYRKTDIFLTKQT